MTNDTEYMKNYMQQYREKNKDSILKAQKKWRDKNKEYQKLYMREYRAKMKAEKMAQS